MVRFPRKGMGEMRWLTCLLVIGMCMGGSLAAHAGRSALEAGSAAQPLAGWFGVFPELPSYQRSFRPPVVAADAARYRQLAQYLWTGNADRTWEVTLARDPLLAQANAPGILRSATPRPRPVYIGKRLGWLWDLQPGSHERVRWRLVVVLAPDRVFTLEGKGLGPWEDPRAVAARFDLDGIAAALTSPPRTDFRRSLTAFRKLTKGVSYGDVVAWVGPADADLGSGIHVLAYRLPDGSKILLGFAEYQHLLYARHMRPDGTADTLVG